VKLIPSPPKSRTVNEDNVHALKNGVDENILLLYVAGFKHRIFRAADQ
jgi:hypothetical protein